MYEPTTIDKIYNSELNFSITCFWDSGYTIKLGDEHNGFVEESFAKNWREAQDVLVGMVLRRYPDCNFAKS